MNNKYFIIAFALIVFGLKLILKDYELPYKYLPVFSLLKTVFLLVLIVCLLHVLSFFVFALLTRNRPESWWEMLENKKRETVKENLQKNYVRILVITIPVLQYGTIVYLAIFQPWRTILIFTIIFIITQSVSYYQNQKRQDSQQF